MTESPYAALQPGDQVWLHSRLGRSGPTMEEVIAVRRTRMDVTQNGRTQRPITVSRINGRDKEYDGYYWIRTPEQKVEAERRDVAVKTLADAGLRFDHSRERQMPTATLERLAAVIREATE